MSYLNPLKDYPRTFKDEKGKEKPILHVDMDNVIFNYTKRWIDFKTEFPHVEWPQGTPGFFESLPPIEGAIDAVNQLRQKYDLWILTRSSPKNPLSYTEKALSILKHFDYDLSARIFMVPTKSLVIGDILIDDNIHEGFIGKSILFGSDEFPDWNAVLLHLM